MSTPIDYPDFATSEHHATAIFNQTVPLGVANNQVDTRTVTVLNGTSQTFGPFTVGQIGYELAMSFSASAASGQPLIVTLTWTDITTGILTDVDRYSIRAGPVATPHVVRMFGRSKANQVTIKIDNTATLADANITYVLLQQSRVYQREHFRTITWGQLAGDTIPVINMPENYICISSPTVPGSGQQIRNLPAYSGNVWLFFSTASLANDAEIAIIDETSTGGTIYDNFTNAQGNLAAYISLPRSQCHANISNHNVAAKLINLTIIVVPPE